MGFTGIKRPRFRARGELIAVLDIGTTKIVCFIARIAEDGSPRIVGIGHQISRGLRAGAIIDMEQAETAIAHAVHAAEQMAGETIREVVVNISGRNALSRTIGVDVAIAGHQVTDIDLRRALRSYGPGDVPTDSDVIHAIPVTYAIDGSRGVRDPRGLFGDTLSVDLHLVSATASAVRNLSTCIGRCHLDVEALMVSPYAAGLSCLVDDERELGSTVIDMGGGTTGIAVFADGAMVFADTVPVGGNHVTRDIAEGLLTPKPYAERMKTLHGSAMSNTSDAHDVIDVPQVGEEEPAAANHVPKSLLTGIIQPRLEEIFELVRARLEDSGFARVAGRRVVLTGGASQLQGVRELAQLVLDKQVRMGRPGAVAGLAESTSGPAFATAIGLLGYATSQADPALVSMGSDEPSNGIWGRLGVWIREYL
ncbi:MAG: cell division protein FtsA [Inquilinaceae bacterium]